MTACTRARRRASAPALPHVWRGLRRAVAVESDWPGGGRGRGGGRGAVGGGAVGGKGGRGVVVGGKGGRGGGVEGGWRSEGREVGAEGRCGTFLYLWVGGSSFFSCFLGGALPRLLLPPCPPPSWVAIAATHWPTPPSTPSVRPGLSVNGGRGSRGGWGGGRMKVGGGKRAGAGRGALRRPPIHAPVGGPRGAPGRRAGRPAPNPRSGAAASAAGAAEEGKARSPLPHYRQGRPALAGGGAACQRRAVRSGVAPPSARRGRPRFGAGWPLPPRSPVPSPPPATASRRPW